MMSIVKAIKKALDELAKLLNTKVESVSVDINHLRSGDYRIKMSFLIKAPGDQKTPEGERIMNKLREIGHIE